jgi:hypothetical protein
MLTVCSHCRRHVRSSEVRCPFCGSVQRTKSSQPSGAVLSVAIGTAVALGCGGEADSPAASRTERTNVFVYGSPPIGGDTSTAGTNSGRGGTVTSGAAATYSSGSGQSPMGGAISSGTSDRGGQSGSGGTGTWSVGTGGVGTGGVGTGSMVVVYGPPPPSGGTSSAGGDSGVGGSARGGTSSTTQGGVSGSNAFTYPSGGVVPPYGLPPFGGAHSGGTSGSAMAGASGKGGTSMAGGAGYGASVSTVPCPAVKCGNACPDGRWLELDGCTYCSCAPPKAQLDNGTFACPSDSLVLSAVSSYYIGGIDRWDIEFTWICTATVTGLGQPLRATLEASITQSPPTVIGSASQIFYVPSTTTTTPFPRPIASVYVAGSGVAEIEVALDVTNSFIVLRREGDRLVGGIYYVGADSSGATTYTLAGPFDVPVPTT